jgi:hypothetical protein
MAKREMRIEVIDDATAAKLRRMSPDERLDAANVLMIQLGDMLRESLRERYPQWGEQKLREEWRRRMRGGTE